MTGMLRWAPLALVLALAPCGALAQAWREYAYPDQGFVVQLPVQPQVQTSAVKTAAGASAPMHSYSARQDGIAYSLDVVDFSGQAVDQKDAIAAAEKSLTAGGVVTVAIDARINRAFGRELSVKGADGSRSAIAIFFVANRLYELVGRSLAPDAAARSGDAIRFQQSLQFTGDGGGFGGPGGGFGGRGRRGGGGFNPQGAAACMGKAAGARVQLETPMGSLPATCVLIARPDRPPGGGPDGPPPPPDD